MKIAFYKTGGNWFDKLIRWWTFGPYSHVELIDKRGNLYSASQHHNMVRVARFRLKPEHWDVFELSDNLSEKRALYFIRSQMHFKYDWIGILLSQVIPLRIHEPNKWFCSELVFAALQHAGLNSNHKSYNIHPNKLYKILKNSGYIRE